MEAYCIACTRVSALTTTMVAVLIIEFCLIPNCGPDGRPHVLILEFIILVLATNDINVSCNNIIIASSYVKFTHAK